MHCIALIELSIDRIVHVKANYHLMWKLHDLGNSHSRLLRSVVFLPDCYCRFIAL